MYYMKRIVLACFAFCLVLLAPLLVCAEAPKWIWHDNKGAAIQPEEVRFFRKDFELDGKVGKAVLRVAADDEAIVYLNGKEVLRAKDWDKPGAEDVTGGLRNGKNVLAVRGRNIGADIAGVLVVLELQFNRNRSDFIVSDESWRSSGKDERGWPELRFDDAAWAPISIRGKLGDAPWGDVLKVPKATAAESLTVLPGFKAELIHSSEIGQGSWICMTVDPRGRLIISPQSNGQPLLRFTLNRAGQVAKIEKIPAPVRQAMGLLYAHDSLYVNGVGPQGIGLYRLIDANRNDQFEPDEVHFLKKFDGQGEHGYHAVALGPDKMIYVMNGNHTKVPDGISPNSPHRNYDEDLLLPRQWDAGGHAVGVLAPGGYIVRTDPEGKNWELLLAGFRNGYDFDFNTDGEMFTFDSDMEWDWGLPWYRPTRINHCVIGGEYGWRSGSGKWPEYYPDSLPTTVDIGIGSPTGVKFGTASHFPKRYQDALYALDWTYGRIIAVHLRPQGATYTGDYETFLQGKPLNVADIEFGKDGAMYFITGGRGTQSGLYRVSYETRSAERGARSAGNVVLHTPRSAFDQNARPRNQPATLRALRRELESLHGRSDPRAIDFAWPHLRSEDRFIRYAARIAVEWQEVGLWKARALAENDPNGGLTALLALARCSGKETQRELLGALKKFPLDSLSLEQKLDKLRVIQLSFIRQGKPDADLAQLAIEKLNRQYPSEDEWLNRELSQLLIYLEAPDVVAKTLALLDRAPTQEEQAHYAFHLRTLTTGWTLAQRRHYFEWFRFAQESASGRAAESPDRVWAVGHSEELVRWFGEVGRDYSDGASYPKYLANIRRDAVAALTEDERLALGGLLDDPELIAGFKLTKERKFVREWTMADLENSLEQVSRGRNFASGKAAFNDAQCILCHRFVNEGGSVGPELTAAFNKYSRRDVLESIIEPSKVISEQYQDYVIVKHDGDDVSGRIVDENETRVVVQPNPLSPLRMEIPVSEIAERRPARVSSMPSGLLDQLTKEEILDLLAYMESAGKERASNFSR